MPNDLRQILSPAKNIAVIGLSPDESKPSNEVAKFLIECGFNIFPVYPKFDEILGRKVYRNLTQIEGDIDIAVMFRKGEFASELVKDAVKKRRKNAVAAAWYHKQRSRSSCTRKRDKFRAG